MKNLDKILLIDGDLFLFQITSAQEQALPLSEDLVVLAGNPSKCKAMFWDRLHEIQDTLGTDRSVFAFSCPTRRYFRHDILPTYKANRTGSRKPLVYGIMREWVEQEFQGDCYTRHGLEGDDVLGILSTHPTLLGENPKVIVSGDKDMKQVPGEFYHTGDGVLRTITVGEADRAFYKQVLSGDATDGYEGCPGVGPVGATKILDKCATEGGREWDAIVAAYEKAGLNEHVALQQARVARILRAEDYDFKRKEPKLWVPPSDR